MNERPAAGGCATDEGFTLIEVMVALLVFAIVSTGILAGMTTIVQMTGDNRSRITAANLAAQELDTVRAVSDTYTVVSSPTRDIPVGGRTYHLTRTVSWVSSAGMDVSCNSSTNLFYLRVNVRVTWDGMLGTTSGVQNDTILAPPVGSTDGALGAIAIFVKGFADEPVAGVTVSVQVAPGGSGEAPPAPKSTTTDGCTYANGVKPGAYRITISKPGFRDMSGVASPTKDVSVSGGNTSSVTFVYDQAGVVDIGYAFGPQPGAMSQTPAVPANLPVNFTSSGTTSTTAKSVAALFPYSSSYSVTAGPASSNTSTCASIDPSAWSAGVSNGVSLKAGVTPTVMSVQSTTRSVKVPLGAVRVTAPAGATLTATQAAPTGAGNPGCDVTGTTLTWSVPASVSGTTLALPYGSWTISANGTPLTMSAQQVLTNTALPGVSPDGTVTLDPRAAG